MPASPSRFRDPSETVQVVLGKLQPYLDRNPSHPAVVQPVLGSDRIFIAIAGSGCLPLTPDELFGKDAPDQPDPH